MLPTKTLIVLVAVILATCPSGPIAAQTATELKPDAFAITYAADLAAFKRLRGNLADLAGRVRQRPDLFAAKPAQDTTLLRPDTRRQILAIWYPILDNYLALDTLAETYMRFHRLARPEARHKAFHLARGVFLTQYRYALELIADLEQNPVMDTILNEAEPALGMPRGIYAQFKYQYLNVIKAGHYAALEAVAKAFPSAADPWVTQWAAADSRIIRAAGKGPGPRMTLKNGLSIVKWFGHTAWFPVQKGVAQWMGQTKVWRPHHYLIRPRQIETLSQQLKPGDILLERRELYLTNVGIPGFWTHAALFVGTAVQRRSLSQEAGVAAWLQDQGADDLDAMIKHRYPRAWAGLQKPVADGRLPQVIEALAPGVTLTSLHQSAYCDSLAVLRPRLSAKDRAAAVVRAMRYYGRPYDYQFDFGSDASLVCTELIVKSYLPGDKKMGLQLPLENLMGHMVTPANAFVRQFDQAFGSASQQLDLVLFWDGDEKAKKAVSSDVNAFRRTWQRPKWHILVHRTQSRESKP